MSSKEEDKNKQTGTPRTQRRNRKKERELSKQRAEAKSPNVGQLQPLGQSRLTVVSPELLYAEKSKGSNTSEPKEKGEEGKKEEEEGDTEEEENPNEDDNSNVPNMTAILAPFDLDLTHVLTIVCGFGNNSNPVKAVKEFGITSFEDFRSTDYDHKWKYQDSSNSAATVVGNNAQILSAIIAYARDLETQNDQEKDSPQNWTKENFGLWRRNDYSKWRNSGAAAAASSPSSTIVPVTGPSAVSTSSAGDDRTRLNDFNKTSKSEKDYELLKNEEYFYGWKPKFERKAQIHKYKRLLESTYPDTATYRSTLTVNSHDLELFEEQVNFLCIIFQYVLRTVKGKDLARLYPADPIKLWKSLLHHHKGSDASTEAAGKLLQRLYNIDISHFQSKSLFLQEYDTIIDYYNKTNTELMQASMKLQFLRLATIQDKDLYTLYTSYLAARRIAGSTATPNSTYVPDYAEFFEVIKQHAELLDSTNGHNSSPRRPARSPRGQSSKYRANIADSFHDLNVYDSFDSNVTEDYDESLQAFLSEQQYDDDEVDILQAYAAFQQRRAPKKGGVRIPRDVYGSLPVEFKRGWDSLTGEQQQKIAKDSFPKNEDRQQAASQVQVYQSQQFIPTEHIEAMYHVSQASLSYHDDSSYDIGTDNSDGESFDADDDDTSNQDLTVNAAKQLQRARGTANTNAKSRQRNRKLPPKSQLPGGSAIKMLANRASPVMRDGKLVGHLYTISYELKECMPWILASLSSRLLLILHS